MKRIRCALYDRVSHEDQVLHGISLAAQVDALKSYAIEKGYEIVGIYSKMPKEAWDSATKYLIDCGRYMMKQIG